MQNLDKQNISVLQVFLTVLFTSCLLISNILASKQILLPFDITMTGAVVIFPVTYVLSDVFSEVYGYRWSRLTCYFAFLMNLLMAVVFYLVINTAAPSYWPHQEAFATVLGSAPRILFASLSAFLLGDFINDRVFRYMKSDYEQSHKHFGRRAIISSAAGTLVDSMVFLPIAFIGTMPLQTLLIMGIVQVSIKLFYEIMILPLTILVVHKVSYYENKAMQPAM